MCLLRGPSTGNSQSWTEGKMSPWLALTLATLALATATAMETPASVNCVNFNDEYMTCMWNSQGKPEANYSLYYWYNNEESSAVECRRYLQEGWVNTGCWFHKDELNSFRPFQVWVNRSINGREITIPTQKMRLQNLVKLYPPVNLTLATLENHQLLLRWEHDRNPRCLEFKVRYTNNKETAYTEQVVQNQLEFSYSSVDPEKFYTFYVSAKVYYACASTDLWSEWSVPIHWGKNATQGVYSHLFMDSTQNIIIAVSVIVVVIFIAIALLRIERIWVIILPRIPNPSKNFEELFSTHKGNFSEWTGVTKNVVETFRPNLNESICYVSELPLHKDSDQPLEDYGKQTSSTMPRAKSYPKYTFSSAPTSLENLGTGGHCNLIANMNGYVKLVPSQRCGGSLHVASLQPPPHMTPSVGQSPKRSTDPAPDPV